MGNREEPVYRRFEGLCRECDQEFHYYNSIKRHPDYQLCDQCEKADIVETLTGMQTLTGAVEGGNAQWN